jgi:hypothetical protein
MKEIECFEESENKSRMHAMNMRKLEEYQTEIYVDISLTFQKFVEEFDQAKY